MKKRANSLNSATAALANFSDPVAFRVTGNLEAKRFDEFSCLLGL